jgi:hypothetical protein
MTASAKIQFMIHVSRGREPKIADGHHPADIRNNRIVLFSDYFHNTTVEIIAAK